MSHDHRTQSQLTMTRRVQRQQHLPVVDPRRVKPAPNRLRQAYGFPAQA